MSLSCTTVEWRGLTLSSDVSSPFGVRNVSGWDERPGVRYGSPERGGRHGRFTEAPLSDERIVTVTGQIVSQDRDALLAELDAVMWLSDPEAAPELLTITRAGRTRVGFAYLTGFRTPSDLDWAVGRVPFGIEWRCPDPLRYGDLQGVTTSFPDLVGGLEYPLYTDGAGTTLGWLDYGEAPTSGRVELSNEGTAESWPVFEVTGPTPVEGFEVVEVGTGRRLVFEGLVPTGSRLVMDTARGTAVMDGGSDRTLTWFEPSPVPAGGSTEFVFLPRGSRTGAQVTVTWRSAWW